jgi:hypothetical protein
MQGARAILFIVESVGGFYMTDFKRDVLEEYALERIEELKAEGAEYFNQLLHDGEIHHEIFNTDYYICYTGEAVEWMGSHSWECIERVKEWEEFNFGEVTTDLASPFHVVNMYAYIVGDEIIQELNLQPMEEEGEEEEEEEGDASEPEPEPEPEPEEVEPEKVVLLDGAVWVRAKFSSGEWGEVELTGEQIREYTTREANETETDFINRREAIIKKAVEEVEEEEQGGAGGVSV